MSVAIQIAAGAVKKCTHNSQKYKITSTFDLLVDLFTLFLLNFADFRGNVHLVLVRREFGCHHKYIGISQELVPVSLALTWLSLNLNLKCSIFYF